MAIKTPPPPPLPAPKPKKANLLDQHSIKRLLDETATEIVTGKGYREDFRSSNRKLLSGAAAVAVALAAQFYPTKKFPQNRDFLLACIVLYVVFIVVHKFLIKKEKDAILFTHPPASVSSSESLKDFNSVNLLKLGSFNSTGLIVSSKLPRLSDIYTLTIASADPKSISAHKPVQLTKSVTKWFTKDGVLVEGLFWKDVEKLIEDYNRDQKSK